MCSEQVKDTSNWMFHLIFVTYDLKVKFTGISVMKAHFDHLHIIMFTGFKAQPSI